MMQNEIDTEQKPLNSGFGPQTTAEEIVSGLDLNGKVIVVTGGHSGIGLETTRVLSNAGASVVVGARDLQKAHGALATLKNVAAVPLDLADPNSIDQFSETFLASNGALDILINNAGIMATPLMRDSRGYEMQFATNHLGHFQLTARLWQALKNARYPRVVTLSSFGHRFAGVDLEDPNFNMRPYDKWVAYGQSKTANSLFSVELDRRGKEHNISAFAVHPGRILATDLIRYMTDEDMKAAGIVRENGVLKGPGIKSIEQGAATTVWCAVSAQLNNKGGVYCADCDISELTPNGSQLQSGVRRWAIDKYIAAELWNLTEKLTDLTWPQ
jgi:NAD(P)-dependent dehydrogenase (short-subunit alcohol dehydrogenase family)